MRSPSSQAPAAAMAVLGVLALLILTAAILALYIMGPRAGEESVTPATATETPAAPTVAPTRPRPTATPVPATPVPPTPITPTPSVTVNVFFVALGDNGASGLLLGCGDSLIAVPHDIPAGTVTERIAAALTELFSVKDRYVGDQQYYNALYQSNLVVDSVTLDGTTAVVQLSGDYSLGDDCNRPRIEAQIEGTVSDLAEVDAVQVFVNGTPLETILYGGS